MLLIRPILLIFSIAFSGAAQASDWQYAGFSKIGSDETYLFYDAEGISALGFRCKHHQSCAADSPPVLRWLWLTQMPSTRREAAYKRDRHD